MSRAKISTLSFLISLRHTLTISPSLHPVLPSVASQPNISMLPRFPHAYHMFCPSRSPSFNHSNNICIELQILKLTTTQFSPVTCYSVPYRSRSSLSLCNVSFTSYKKDKERLLHREPTLNKLFLCFNLLCRDFVASSATCNYKILTLYGRN